MGANLRDATRSPLVARRMVTICWNYEHIHEYFKVRLLVEGNLEKIAGSALANIPALMSWLYTDPCRKQCASFTAETSSPIV